MIMVDAIIVLRLKHEMRIVVTHFRCLGQSCGLMRVFIGSFEYCEKCSKAQMLLWWQNMSITGGDDSA